ncbi:MAG: 2-oxoglutarate dehydrogenase E1 component [Burkholderiaceae bacterium]|nr:2-oxoglutarate dehydrogenase E1 component [Burkholderiaceae bacterium]
MPQDHADNSYLFAGNAPYVEELYEAFLDDPASVPDNWRTYFNAMQNVPATDGSARADIPHAPIIAAFEERARQPYRALRPSVSPELERKRIAAQQMTSAYRFLGTHWANLDPLQRRSRLHIPELDPAFYGFTDADMDLTFNISNTYFGVETASLRDLLHMLRHTYCRTIGAEFMYLSDHAQKRWMQERLESIQAMPDFTPERKRHILGMLTAAEGLERYLHTRYVGQRRFSIEGSESFLVALDEALQHAGECGIQEIVLGMAHRGRLNVLVNVMGRMLDDLFAPEEEAQRARSGDVKYHLGFVRDISTQGGPVHLSMAFNPSHLEVVNPVAEGSAKARMKLRGDEDGSQVLPILVHGDASFIGQGVVMETLNLAQTRGYTTGGTLHIVINNQIGFTTSDPRDSRSSFYCTDVVKMIEAPILHVNGDYPEAVALAVQIALDFRMEFRKDVVVDVVCYRRLGHNEQDTPAMTQPLMYRKIDAHPGVRHLYVQRLISQGVITEKAAHTMAEEYRARMNAGIPVIDPVITNVSKTFSAWQPFLNAKGDGQADTALPIQELRRLAERITVTPEDIKLHPLVERVLHDRAAMGRGEMPVDWGMGEHLAFASLLSAGFPVRLSGQDSGRGTFVHRHAVIHDQNREDWGVGTYTPLSHINRDQAEFTVIDSVLSEEAVLGFEYGYSTAAPSTLTIWEAQFGDFANGAQVVIDQFICSGEEKWGRVSGLVMLLPHGYEGQGPEHSSARIERYLQLCANDNIEVVQPTTAAQIFHLLRRQMLRMIRRPLIVLTPKSLLRHKSAASSLKDLATGHFMPLIGEMDNRIRPARVKRVLLCSGKVYYDIINTRTERKRNDVAVIRIESLYPFPEALLAEEMAKYPNATEVMWVQDEPENQGAWPQIHLWILNALKTQKLSVTSRPPSSSPAVGYLSKHLAQQADLLSAAFAGMKRTVPTNRPSSN